MSNIRQFISEEDEDDGLLFDKMQEHVLENYPNPDRIGCFDHAMLRAFVEAPGTLDLSDRKYLHILECAECTRELIELRHAREAQIQGVLTSSQSRSDRSWLKPPRWKFAAATLLICAAAIIVAVTSGIRSSRSAHDFQSDVAVLKTIDLSGDGVSRGPEKTSLVHTISLPRKLVSLHLILPYYSQGGSYQITIGKEMNREKVLANATATAVVQGARTDLSVQQSRVTG